MRSHTKAGRIASVYLPNDLYDAWKASGVNLSKVTQNALRRAIRQPKEPADAQNPPQDRR